MYSTRFIPLKSIGIGLMVKWNEKEDTDTLNIHSEISQGFPALVLLIILAR